MVGAPSGSLSDGVPGGPATFSSEACGACQPPQRAYMNGILTPPSVGVGLTLLVGLVMRDVALTRDEVVGLMAGFPTSEAGPTCIIRLGERIAEKGDGPGRRVRINWHRWPLGEPRRRNLIQPERWLIAGHS